MQILDISLDEFIRFIKLNNLNVIFYNYVYASAEDLIIDDRLINELRLDSDIVNILQDKFDEYNQDVDNLDYSRPIAFYTYCINQGVTMYIRESDYWFQDEGYNFPEIVAMELITNNFEFVLENKKNLNKERLTVREEFKQVLLDNNEFLECTNGSLRKAFVQRFFKNEENNKYRNAFWSRESGYYDITINQFVEEIWREYKNMKNNCYKKTKD